MTLTLWLEQNFTHVTLDTVIHGKNNSNIKVPEHNVDLTIGLISTSSKQEFAKLAFNFVPVGTIIDTIDDEWYESKVLLVRNMLTKALLTDKRARHYLDILERRDAQHWADQNKKSLKVENSTDNKSLNITFSTLL